jgi:hypothetical protein
MTIAQFNEEFFEYLRKHNVNKRTYDIRYDHQSIETCVSELQPCAMLDTMIDKYPNAGTLEIRYTDERGSFHLTFYRPDEYSPAN